MKIVKSHKFLVIVNGSHLDSYVLTECSCLKSRKINISFFLVSDVTWRYCPLIRLARCHLLLNVSSNFGIDNLDPSKAFSGVGSSGNPSSTPKGISYFTSEATPSIYLSRTSFVTAGSLCVLGFRTCLPPCKGL